MRCSDAATSVAGCRAWLPQRWYLCLVSQKGTGWPLAKKAIQRILAWRTGCLRAGDTMFREQTNDDGWPRLQYRRLMTWEVTLLWDLGFGFISKQLFLKALIFIEEQSTSLLCGSSGKQSHLIRQMVTRGSKVTFFLFPCHVWSRLRDQRGQHLLENTQHRW